MKYLGIDYGTKKVGLAVSDDGGKIAFPKSVLKNDKNLLPEIKKLCEEEKIGAVVIGESYVGKTPNVIMKDIKDFSEKAKLALCISVYFQNEIFTSDEARRSGSKSIDASAAAIMLQRFLDKNS